jgi:hypothetical protein
MNLYRLMRWSAALVLIAVAVGGAGMGILARSAPPEPERQSSAKPADNRYRVTMAGGTTFEVIAIQKDWSKAWWRPDGNPLNESPADPSQDLYFMKPGELRRTVLVRVENLPEDATLKWVPTYDDCCLEYRGDDSGAGVTKDGRRVRELRAYVVSVHPDRRTGSVQIQLAAGPWKTVVSHRGGRRDTGITIIDERHQFCFGTARPYRGGTTITVAHNLVDANLHLRLVAVDRQGKEHQPSYYADADARTSHSFVNHFGKEQPANYSSGATGEIFSMLDTEFSLPFDQIQEFRVQSRPFERAEINDIALQPRPAAK